MIKSLDSRLKILGPSGVPGRSGLKAIPGGKALTIRDDCGSSLSYAAELQFSIPNRSPIAPAAASVLPTDWSTKGHLVMHEICCGWHGIRLIQDLDFLASSLENSQNFIDRKTLRRLFSGILAALPP